MRPGPRCRLGSCGQATIACTTRSRVSHRATAVRATAPLRSGWTPSRFRRSSCEHRRRAFRSQQRPAKHPPRTGPGAAACCADALPMSTAASARAPRRLVRSWSASVRASKHSLRNHCGGRWRNCGRTVSEVGPWGYLSRVLRQCSAGKAGGSPASELPVIIRPSPMRWKRGRRRTSTAWLANIVRTNDFVWALLKNAFSRARAFDQPEPAIDALKSLLRESPSLRFLKKKE
jgi:hypothetical protein